MLVAPTKTHLGQIWLGDVFSLSMDHNRKAYRIDVPLMAWDKPSNLVIICNPIQPGIIRLPTDPKVALSGVTLTCKKGWWDGVTVNHSKIFEVIIGS